MKSKFVKVKKQGEDVSLQITSMADIFVILLVFLLKSYSTSMSNLTLTGDVALPEGQATIELKEALKVEITKDAVLIDQKPVAKLKKFEFSSESAEADESSMNKALKKHRKVNDKNSSDLVVISDERTPSETLQRVMSVAAGSGFVDLQLVVVRPE